MYIHGHFYNAQDEKVSVYIVTGGDRTEEVEIGTEESGIYFTDDPVEITSQVNDTFDHLLCSQASIRLLCRDYQPGFFCNSCREAVVNIYRGEECLFAGYIEPQAYSQGYNEVLDEVELTCIDALSALQYSNYAGIGSLGVNYAAVKSKASQRTFLSLLEEVIGGVTDGISLLDSSAIIPIYYDNSKALADAGDYDIFDNISISELLFLGDEEDDVWTQETVLTEVLRYLNLHVVQIGLQFYIFSWETIRKGGTIAWGCISGGLDNVTAAAQTIDVKTAIVADCDTQIEVSETYNQLLLTDSVTEVENLVENPMDSDSLVPAFGNYQKYMTEYIAEGEGKAAIEAFGGMVTGTGSDWDAASQVDWYMWVKNNPQWKFYCTDSNGSRVDVYEKYCSQGTNQHAVLSQCLRRGIGAALVAFGSVEKKNGGSDNTPASAPDLKDYLVIGLDTIETATYYDKSILRPHGGAVSTYLEDGTKLQAAIPVAEYIGNVAGGTFSPSDDETTNYIQISGKMVLNPLMDVTASYAIAHAHRGWGKNDTYWHWTMPSRNNSDGRYYTQRFYKAASWKDDPTDDDSANATKQSRGVYPFTDTGPQQYEFDYNAANEAKDTVSKVGVLQCMLIIGDKCVVETLPDNGGSGNGEPEDFSWQPYKERSECADDDEYYAQSFAIGFDPKLKDKLIGTEFDIQKNAPYTIGITVEGTVIPIKKSDKVSGQVKFYILGAVNEEWLNVTKRHHTFFRHTKYYTDSVPLLNHVSSIMVRDLEIKVVSNNGKIGAVEDENDIVYMSDTKETFVNKKDDLEFKITTALTSAECSQLGVNNSVKLSSPQNMLTGDALLTIIDSNSGETAKPEQVYVDAYWKEWHEPRVIMTQNFMDGSYISPWNLYRHPAMGKTFHVEGISRNLYEGTAEVVMKEVF